MQNSKKNWGVRSRDRVRDRGVNRVRVRDRGINRDRVSAGDEHIIPFEKHPLPPPRKKKKN